MTDQTVWYVSGANYYHRNPSCSHLDKTDREPRHGTESQIGVFRECCSLCADYDGDLSEQCADAGRAAGAQSVYVSDRRVADKDWLYEQYWGEQRPMRELAEDANVSYDAVRYHMERLGIPRRPKRGEGNSVSPFAGFYGAGKCPPDRRQADDDTQRDWTEVRG